VVNHDLPRFRRLGNFYWLTWFGLPDIWLGDLSRPGPFCFCHSARRYRDFSRPLLLATQLNAVLRAVDPDPGLRAVFGTPYSHKRPWPWKEGRGARAEGRERVEGSRR
jgi:hypothetical protein